MAILKIFAPAKLNLCLDVIKREPSGYHQIETVYFLYEGLKDEIILETGQNTDSLSIYQGGKNPTAQNIPEDENLAFKAAQALKRSCGMMGPESKFIKITITKNIPLSSGLGGPSSDAAAVLCGLNKLWDIDLPLQTLQNIGQNLGKDVPFFVLAHEAGTKIAHGTHYGEIVKPLPDVEGLKFKVQKSSGGPSKTFEAYSRLDLSLCAQNRAKTQVLIGAIKANDPAKILENLHNDFETLEDYAKLPKGEHLTGAGPSTFLPTI